MPKPKRKIDEVFPILAIEEGLIIGKNGDLTVGFELSMPEIFTTSTADYERMHSVFSRALGAIETNIIVHKQDWYLVEKYEAQYDRYQDSVAILGRSDERSFAERDYLRHPSYGCCAEKEEQSLFPPVSQAGSQRSNRCCLQTTDTGNC